MTSAFKVCTLSSSELFPPTPQIDFVPTVSVKSISLPLDIKDHKVALCTCNAPLERTVCLTDGLNATGETILEDRDSFAVLKLMFACSADDNVQRQK